MQMRKLLLDAHVKLLSRLGGQQSTQPFSNSLKEKIMKFLRLSLCGAVLFCVFFVLFKYIVLDTRQCDPVSSPAVQVEESVSDEVAARYHLRGRVNRFFKRSRKA